MRHVENLLLTVGATALGACVFGLAAFGYVAATDSGTHGPNDMSGVAVLVVLTIWGAAIGGIVGLTSAILRIARHSSQPWTAGTWIAIGLGALLGLALHCAGPAVRSSVLADLLQFWPTVALLAAALATLCGIAARIAAALWHRRRDRKCASDSAPTGRGKS